MRWPHDRSCLVEMVPFGLAHAACFAAIWTGVGSADLVIAAGLYGIRLFGVTAGYHRYFSHRSFKTGRVVQFVLAFVAQSSAQRGVLWWAANHRYHHRFSDTEDDVHSPVLRGFWYAHFGWFFTRRHQSTDLAAVPDLATDRELLWLDRHPYLPAFLTGFLVWLFAGWSGLVVGFFWSTVVLWHATFSINSLAHVVGSRRYETADQSRNNWGLAILTFGEGWHNNHHHFQSAARQGFRWYEIDITYYGLRVLSAMGLVWALRSPPPAVLSSEQRLRRSVVERAAAQLASSFQVEAIAGKLIRQPGEKRASLSISIDELNSNLAGMIGGWRLQLDRNVETARHKFQHALRTVHIPVMPTMTELRDRADAMFVSSPSTNDIVERGWQILVDEVFEEILRRNGMISSSKA